MGTPSAHAARRQARKVTKNQPAPDNNSQHSIPIVGDSWRTVYAYLGVFVLSVAVYWNSLSGDLVHDDIYAIVNNPDVVGDTPLWQLLAHDFWGRPMSDISSHKSYRPLTVLSFRLNHWLHGLDPLGYHVVNVLGHGLVCVLLTMTCRTVVFRNDQRAALTAGIIFAVHPIHTEAVSGVVGRADILAAALFLMSFMLYRRVSTEVDSFHTPWLMLSLLLAGAAMLAKEIGITVLGVCVVCDGLLVFHHIRKRWSCDKFKCGRNQFPPRQYIKGHTQLTVFFVFVSLLIRLCMNGFKAPAFSDQDNPAAANPQALTRLMTFAYLVAANAWLLLCPRQLSYDWQMGTIPLVKSWNDGRNLQTLLCFVVLLSIFYRAMQLQARSNRTLLWGFLMLVIPFLPASNMFFPVGFVVAERVLYIPSMGYIIIVVYAGNELYARVKGRPLLWWTVLLLMSVSWGLKTLARNRVWNSRETLFRSGLQSAPQNAKMHYNYGNYLKDFGRTDEAVHFYTMALSLWPKHASSHNNLGTLSADDSVAEFHFREALRLNPSHGGAHFNLGRTLLRRGDVLAAADELHLAVSIDLPNAEAHVTLADVLLQIGKHIDAESHYRRACDLDPENADMHNFLAVFYEKQGRLEEAEVTYRRALQVDFQHRNAMVNLARLLRANGKVDEAADYFRRALLLNRDSETLNLAGLFYFSVGRDTEALSLFKEASFFPGHTEAKFHYAQVLASLGKYKEAKERLIEVLDTNPRHVEAMQQMANIMGLTGDHGKGLDILEKAISLTEDPGMRSQLYTNQGNQYKDMGIIDKALKSYERALFYNPEVFNAHINVGVIHHLEGRFAEARHHYNAAKRLQSTHDVLLENLRKLDYDEKMQSNEEGSKIFPSNKNSTVAVHSSLEEERTTFDNKTMSVSMEIIVDSGKHAILTSNEDARTFTNNRTAVDLNSSHTTDSPLVNHMDKKPSYLQCDNKQGMEQNEPCSCLACSLDMDDDLSYGVDGIFVIYPNTSSLCENRTDRKSNGTM